MRGALLLASALLLAAPAAAVGVKLRPQGEALTQAVQAALAELSTKDIPLTLDPASGTTLTLGGVGVSAAPFNPDVAARVVTVGNERRIEFNPSGPLPLADAVRQELTRELGLKEWTPAAAGARFGGADLNADGMVDLVDLAILMENLGKEGAVTGDLNQDRRVNDADLRVFSSLYRITDPPAPQPAPITAPANPAPSTAPTPGTATPGTPGPATPTPPTPATPNPPTPGPAAPAPGEPPPSAP
ncbi:hypothetical protein SAMN04488058_101101 [Deinococcus reticulitermitis]|uniref:Dockerin domain-containing protein n=1 Tax=Deinococcus reticulitermitis TaxID=856736 RepID=A0A1H6S869_9DEIO|nr:hypothetical protein [Deinococcus reticulitermitis]SEI60220.1 hypothetical protein SAMN04488058_101101 [Deinococcus reticulitermitis]